MSLKAFLTLLLVFSHLFSASPQSSCDYTINHGNDYIDASNLKINPGDTVCIEGGQRKFLQIKNLKGDSLKPITLINKGEVIVKNTDFYYGLKLVDCKYFRLTGTGDKKLEQGIKVLGTGPRAVGLSISGKSSDFEIDHIEVANAGFAGIMSKADPECDRSLNRGIFTQKNLSFHHNYIHDVKGEGFYIGNSFYNGFMRNKRCEGDTLFPHEIKNLSIYHNYVENTGWEGVQIGCATQNVTVFNNYIQNFGIEKKSTQNNGLQIGEGSSGLYYNNIIINGSGNGIIILGKGNTIVYNNFIGYCKASGIFCDNRLTTESSLIAILNNTITRYGKNAICWYNEKTRNVFQNNLIVDPEADSTAFLFLPKTIKHESQNNKTFSETNIPGLKMTGEKIILLNKECRLFNAGTDISKYLPSAITPKHHHIGAYFD